MKSPLPLLAIGAAFLLLKGKKGGQKPCDPLDETTWGEGNICVNRDGVWVREPKDNLMAVTANSAIPMLRGPYIQVTSSYAPDFISVDDLEDVVRPIAEQNLEFKFIIAAADGIDRLKMAQHADLNTPDQFTVTAMHGEGEVPMVEVVGGPDATLTSLGEEVAGAVAYMRAPFSPNG